MLEHPSHEGGDRDRRRRGARHQHRLHAGRGRRHGRRAARARESSAAVRRASRSAACAAVLGRAERRAGRAQPGALHVAQRPGARHRVRQGRLPVPAAHAGALERIERSSRCRTSTASRAASSPPARPHALRADDRSGSLPRARRTAPTDGHARPRPPSPPRASRRAGAGRPHPGGCEVRGHRRARRRDHRRAHDARLDRHLDGDLRRGCVVGADRGDGRRRARRAPDPASDRVQRASSRHAAGAVHDRPREQLLLPQRRRRDAARHIRPRAGARASTATTPGAGCPRCAARRALRPALADLPLTPRLGRACTR